MICRLGQWQRERIKYPMMGREPRVEVQLNVPPQMDITWLEVGELTSSLTLLRINGTMRR